MKKIILLLLVAFAIPVFAANIKNSDPQILSQDDIDFLTNAEKNDSFYSEQLEEHAKQQKVDEKYYAKITALFQGNRPIKSIPYKKARFSEDISLPQITIPSLSQAQLDYYSFKDKLNAIDERHQKRIKKLNQARKAIETTIWFNKHKVHTGPRGGRYVYTSSGDKRYIKH